VLKDLRWPLWLPEGWYNEGYDTFIALQIPVRVAQVLWLVSVAKRTVRLHTAGEVWYLRLLCC